MVNHHRPPGWWNPEARDVALPVHGIRRGEHVLFDYVCVSNPVVVFPSRVQHVLTHVLVKLSHGGTLVLSNHSVACSR